jgi:trans-aconitate methyltransferase
VFLVFAAFFISQFYNIIFRGFAPFIASKKSVINKIIENLEIKDGQKVYELGCGQANFLRQAERKNPKAKFIGVEYSFLPYVLAETQLSFSNSHINFKKENFYKTDLHDADIVYCYLNVKTMIGLEKKFIAECKPGTQIVSYQFPLPNRTADKVLEIDKNDKVYFYTL